MKFFIEIDVENDAFKAPGGEFESTARDNETARIIRKQVLTELDHEIDPAGGPLKDCNGNTVGEWGWRRTVDDVADENDDMEDEDDQEGDDFGNIHDDTPSLDTSFHDHEMDV